MPNPIPLANISAAEFELDFIQKMAPVEPSGSIGVPPVDFGEQRFESGLQLGENKGSKKRWTSLVTPFRMITTSLAGWTELQKNPDFYWSQISWGICAVFMRNYVTGQGWFFGAPSDVSFLTGLWQDNRWLNGGPIAWHQYLTSVGMDGTPPGIGTVDGNITVRVMQFLPTQDQDYQIWKVTTREPIFADFADPNFTYEGFTPGTYPPITAEIPFAGLTDYAEVTSGRLTAFVPFVLPPHDLQPRVNCQIPPAGCLVDGVTRTQDDNNWRGWGVSNFLVLL